MVSCMAKQQQEENAFTLKNPANNDLASTFMFSKDFYLLICGEIL